MATVHATETEPGQATAGVAVTVDTRGSSVWTASMGILMWRETTAFLSVQSATPPAKLAQDRPIRIVTSVNLDGRRMRRGPVMM
uniref:Uncharacterized protein n=1 Tax=Anguilla anguilla TaxID=7936 RepID=A0A0E9W7I4_ANGAN